MLKSLSLQNFALIEHLELDFEQGLHILSGDTGAGKSLIFDALHLLAGQKSDGIWVRESAAKADLRCELKLDLVKSGDQALRALLREFELEDEDNPSSLRLRRIIYKDGRSKAQVNGVPVKASILKRMTEHCFLFHDQHESMELLKPLTQLNWLDQFGQHQTYRQKYESSFKAWQSLTQQQAKLEATQRAAAQRRDYLEYQLQEMVNLNLESDYIAGLETRLKSQDHAARWAGQAQNLDALLGSENEGLGQLRHWLAQIQLDKDPHPSCVAAARLLDSAFIHLDEASSEVAFIDGDIEFDEAELAQAQQELSKVFELSRKHQVPVHELETLRANIVQELGTLEGNESKLEVVGAQVLVAREEVDGFGDTLSRARQKAAPKLAQLLSDALAELGMLETQWEVQVNRQAEPKLHGFDDVCFLLSSNKGHKPQALSKIASGGELSRVSLVLHAYGRGDVQTTSQVYCFDEVDVGVSGQVAGAIGRLLRQLAQEYQVFCISHAPQVAAQPGFHWRATKALTPQDRVASHWAMLDQRQRVEEIARMLGTASKPEMTLAKKLLDHQDSVLEH